MKHKVVSVILYCYFLVCIAIIANTEEIKTIPLYSGRVGSFAFPNELVVNSKLKRVYVTCSDSDNVAVIDGISNSITHSINVGSYPTDIAINSETGKVYVANSSNTISVIDEQSLSSIATLEVRADYMAIDSRKNRLYAVGWEWSDSRYNSLVSVFNEKDLNLITTFKIVGSPSGIAVNSGSNEIYVVTSDNIISVVNGEDFKVISTILNKVDVDEYNYISNIGFDSNANLLYILNSGTNTVNIIDTNARKFVSTLSVGEYPNHISINPDSGMAYISTKEYVYVISSKNRNVSNTIGNVGFYTTGIAVDPASKKLYLVTDFYNEIYVIDTTQNQVLKKVTFWGGLSEIDINTSGNSLYVLDSSGDSIVALNTQDFRINAIGDGGRSTQQMGFNNVMNEIYVTRYYDYSALVLDGLNLNSITSIRSNGSPGSITIDNQRNLIYFSDDYNKDIMKVDGKNHSIINSKRINMYPNDIAVNTQTNRLYIIGYEYMYVLDGSTLGDIQKIKLANYSTLHSVAVNPKTNKIYVSDYNFVYVIDGNSNSKIATIRVVSSAGGICVNTRTNEIYVANYGIGTVSIIDGNNNQVVANVKVGKHPRNIICHPQFDEIYVTNYGEGSITVIKDLSRASFKIPNIMSPSSDKTLYTLSPTLRWSGIENAVSYAIEVAKDEKFSNVISYVSDIKTTQYDIPSESLQYNNAYYWHVRAEYKNGSGGWSPISKLNIGPPSFTLSLAKGLNFISLPMKPDIPYIAKTFAEKLGATLVIKYDANRQEFVPFVPEASSSSGFVIEGGQGYVVNVLEPKQILLLGTLWTNSMPYAPQKKLGEDNSLWAFAIAGHVENELAYWLGELQITVRNKNTGMPSRSAIMSDDNEFAVAFIDMNRKNVIRSGDVLEIKVVDNEGQLVSNVEQKITDVDIGKAILVVNLNLREIRPTKTKLLQNYPNPFNPDTWIPFQLAESADVIINIYDTTGCLIRSLHLGNKSAGMYVGKAKSAYWDGRNENGEIVSSGVYFYSIDTGNYKATRKFSLVK